MEKSLEETQEAVLKADSDSTAVEDESEIAEILEELEAFYQTHPKEATVISLANHNVLFQAYREAIFTYLRKKHLGSVKEYLIEHNILDPGFRNQPVNAVSEKEAKEIPAILKELKQYYLIHPKTRQVLDLLTCHPAIRQNAPQIRRYIHETFHTTVRGYFLQEDILDPAAAGIVETKRIQRPKSGLIPAEISELLQEIRQSYEGLPKPTSVKELVKENATFRNNLSKIQKSILASGQGTLQTFLVRNGVIVPKGTDQSAEWKSLVNKILETFGEQPSVKTSAEVFSGMPQYQKYESQLQSMAPDLLGMGWEDYLIEKQILSRPGELAKPEESPIEEDLPHSEETELVFDVEPVPEAEDFTEEIPAEESKIEEDHSHFEESEEIPDPKTERKPEDSIEEILEEASKDVADLSSYEEPEEIREEEPVPEPDESVEEIPAEENSTSLEKPELLLEEVPEAEVTTEPEQMCQPSEELPIEKMLEETAEENLEEQSPAMLLQENLQEEQEESRETSVEVETEAAIPEGVVQEDSVCKEEKEQSAEEPEPSKGHVLQILQFDLQGTLRWSYSSIISAARRNGYSTSAMLHLLDGISHVSDSFLWFYSDSREVELRNGEYHLKEEVVQKIQKEIAEAELSKADPKPDSQKEESRTEQTEDETAVVTEEPLKEIPILEELSEPAAEKEEVIEEQVRIPLEETEESAEESIEESIAVEKEATDDSRSFEENAEENEIVESGEPISESMTPKKDVVDYQGIQQLKETQKLLEEIGISSEMTTQGMLALWVHASREEWMILDAVAEKETYDVCFYPEGTSIDRKIPTWRITLPKYQIEPTGILLSEIRGETQVNKNSEEARASAFDRVIAKMISLGYRCSRSSRNIHRIRVYAQFKASKTMGTVAASEHCSAKYRSNGNQSYWAFSYEERNDPAETPVVKPEKETVSPVNVPKRPSENKFVIETVPMNAEDIHADYEIKKLNLNDIDSVMLYLCDKLQNDKLIGYDLLQIAANEKIKKQIHRKADESLISYLQTYSPSPLRSGAILISMVLSAMDHYNDNSFWPYVHEEHAALYEKVYGQKVDILIRRVISTYTKLNDRPINYVIRQAIIPCFYLPSFIDFVYEIYKNTLKYDLPSNLNFVLANVYLDVSNAYENTNANGYTKAHTTKLIKTIKDIIDTANWFSELIAYTTLILHYIDHYYWEDQVKETLPYEDYLVPYFEEWKRKNQGEIFVEREVIRQQRTGWSASFVLRGTDVYLQIPNLILKKNTNVSRVHITISNGNQRLYDIDHISPHEAIGGYIVDGMKKKIENPLGTLRYRVFEGNVQIFNSGTQLERPYLIFNEKNTELKKKSTYVGNIQIVGKNLSEIDGVEVYYNNTYYSIGNRFMKEYDSIQILGENICFSEIHEQKLSGEIIRGVKIKSLHHEFVLYRSVQELIFLSPLKASDLTLSVNQLNYHVGNCLIASLPEQYAYKVYIGDKIRPGFNQIQIMDQTSSSHLYKINLFADPDFEAEMNLVEQDQIQLTLKSSLLKQQKFMADKNADRLFSLPFTSASFEHELHLEIESTIPVYKLDQQPWQLCKQELSIKELSAYSQIQLEGIDFNRAAIVSQDTKVNEELILREQDGHRFLSLERVRAHEGDADYDRLLLIFYKDMIVTDMIAIYLKAVIENGDFAIRYNEAEKSALLHFSYRGKDEIHVTVKDRQTEIYEETVTGNPVDITIPAIQAMHAYEVIIQGGEEDIFSLSSGQYVMLQQKFSFYSLADLVGNTFTVEQGEIRPIGHGNGVSLEERNHPFEGIQLKFIRKMDEDRYKGEIQQRRVDQKNAKLYRTQVDIELVGEISNGRFWCIVNSNKKSLYYYYEQRSILTERAINPDKLQRYYEILQMQCKEVVE